MKAARVVVVLLLILQACKKNGPEIQQCTNSPGRTAYSVYFSEYEPADVDTIYVRHFVSDGSFSSLMSIDTILSPHATKSGDTVFKDSITRTKQHSGTRFLYCDNRADYEVVVPAVSKTYRIWDINYGADTLSYYDPPCARTNFGVTYPYGAQVDGAHEIVSWQYGPDIFLKP